MEISLDNELYNLINLFSYEKNILIEIYDNPISDFFRKFFLFVTCFISRPLDFFNFLFLLSFLGVNSLLLVGCNAVNNETGEPPWWKNPHRDDSWHYYQNAASGPSENSDEAHNKAFRNAVSLLLKRALSNVDMEGRKIDFSGQYELSDVQIVNGEQAKKIDGKWYQWILIRVSKQDIEELKRMIQLNRRKYKKYLKTALEAESEKYYLKALKNLQAAENLNYLNKKSYLKIKEKINSIPDPIPKMDILREKLSGGIFVECSEKDYKKLLVKNLASKGFSILSKKDFDELKKNENNQISKKLKVFLLVLKTDEKKADIPGGGDEKLIEIVFKWHLMQFPGKKIIGGGVVKPGITLKGNENKLMEKFIETFFDSELISLKI